MSDSKWAQKRGNQHAADLCLRLFEQAEQKQKMRFDTDADAIEYRKDPMAYTFTPTITGDKRAGKRMDPFTPQKNVKRTPVREAVNETGPHEEEEVRNIDTNPPAREDEQEPFPDDVEQYEQVD